MTDYVTLFKEMNSKVGDVFAANPGLKNGWIGLKTGVEKEGGALSLQQKELIALTLGVAAQCEPCIAFHAKMCADLGISRAEVADALGVCVMMGGGPKLMYAGKALEAFDQFTAAQK